MNVKTEQIHGKPAGQSIVDYPLMYYMNMSISNITSWVKGPLIFYSEPLSEEEGFSKIDKVDVQLVCDTPYKVS